MASYTIDLEIIPYILTIGKEKIKIGNSMAISTLTSKGQVTIPKEIRARLHLHSGDKIEFSIKENGEAVIRPICKKVDEVFGRLYKNIKKSVSIEEMNQAIKKQLKAKFK